MRVLIPFCRHCIVDKDVCAHREMISDCLRHVLPKLTVTHKCPVYESTVPIGARVEVALKQLFIQDIPGSCWEPPSTNCQWIDAGTATGRVENYSKKGYFVVKLDTPVELCIPERGQIWQQAEVRMIDTVVRHGRTLKIITDMPL